MKFKPHAKTAKFAKVGTKPSQDWREDDSSDESKTIDSGILCGLCVRHPRANYFPRVRSSFNCVTTEL
jgi:hypothetical protein